MKRTNKNYKAQQGIIGSGKDLEDKIRTAALAYIEIRGGCKAVGRAIFRQVGAIFGVSEDTARRWLEHPVAKAVIAERLAAVEAKIGARADRILEELMQIAYSDIKDYFVERNVTENGDNVTSVTCDGGDAALRYGQPDVELKAPTRMGKESRAVRRIKHQKIKRTVGRGESQKVEYENRYEYELWDKLGALRMLAEIKRLALPGDKSPGGGNNVYIYLPDNGFGGKGLQTRQTVLTEDISDVAEATARELEVDSGNDGDGDTKKEDDNNETY